MLFFSSICDSAATLIRTRSDFALLIGKTIKATLPMLSLSLPVSLSLSLSLSLSRLFWTNLLLILEENFNELFNHQVENSANVNVTLLFFLSCLCPGLYFLPPPKLGVERPQMRFSGSGQTSHLFWRRSRRPFHFWTSLFDLFSTTDKSL